MRRFVPSSAAAAAAVVAAQALAQPLGSSFTYQGLINQGAAAASGTFDLRFRLFTASSGGSQVGSQVCVNNVAVSQGRFSVTLDFGDTAFTSSQRFLEIDLRTDTGADCSDATGFILVSPRQAVSQTPNALRAATADNAANLNGVAAASYGRTDNTGLTNWAGTQTFSSGAGGIGGLFLRRPDTDATTAGSFIRATNTSGVLTFSLPATGGTLIGTGNTSALTLAGDITGSAAASSVVRLRGINLSSTPPADGQVLKFNSGVWQPAPDQASTTLAGAGLSLSGSTLSIGPSSVVNTMLAPDAASLNRVTGGLANASGPNIGLGTISPAAKLHLFNGDSGDRVPTTDALLAIENSGPAYAQFLTPVGFGSGILFSNYSTASQVNAGVVYNAITVNALQFMTGGENIRMTVTAAGDVGIGDTVPGARLRVRGADTLGDIWVSPNVANANSQLFLSENTSGSFGMISRYNGATNNLEVIGVNTSVETTPRITINRGTTGGVTVANNLSVGGTLSKGGGAFRIDHPLDPANKELWHSFVESPDMMNVYNGNTVTDEAGYATITLPDWFEALNKDFRYQLTILDEGDQADAFLWAKVTRKIKGNQFTIRSSRGNLEVSWQVTGIRRDAFAEKNRIPTVVDKPAHARGKYLHPEAFGRPAADVTPAAPTAPDDGTAD